MEIWERVLQTGEQQAHETQAPSSTDDFKGSQTPKAHLQILPWISDEESLIVANSLGLQARK